MALWGGLMGPKNENVEKPPVLLLFWWGSRLEIRPRRRSRRPWLGGLGSSKKCDLSLKMLYAAISNCASCAGGENIFRNSWKQVVGKWKMEPKNLRWHMWMVYVRAWWGQGAKMLKTHWLYCYFLKGQGCHEEVQKRNSQVGRTIFHKKYFVPTSRIAFPV